MPQASFLSYGQVARLVMSKRGNLLEEKRFRCDTFRICELDPNTLSFSRLVYLVFFRRESGGGSASCLYSFPLYPLSLPSPYYVLFLFCPEGFCSWATIGVKMRECTPSTHACFYMSTRQRPLENKQRFLVP